MKFKFKTLIFLCIFSQILLCSCKPTNSLIDETSGAESSSESAETTEASASESFSQTGVIYNELSRSYSIDSYLTLENAVKSNSILYLEREQHEETYSQMVAALSEETEHLYIPQIGEANADLRNTPGLSNITVFTNELYALPWIWYHCTAHGADVTVKLTYLSVAGVDASNTDSCSELLREIAPNAVNTHNYTSFSSYENVTEIELALADRTVSALKYELKDSSRCFMAFAFEDVYVMVSADASILTDHFWSAFTLK